MARCVLRGCEEDPAVLHLFRGAAGYPISETTDYTGASFCSWAHLSEWVRDPHRDQHFEVPESAPSGEAGVSRG